MLGTPGYKYVYYMKHINDVLEKVKTTGRPDKLTITYLRDTWLLKDAKYSAVLDILRDMTFIDESGTPQNLYAEYQNQSISRTILAKGIIKAYSELFKAYPNAHKVSKETITGYFKQKTGADKAILEKIVGTFYTFCSLADFSISENSSIKIDKNDSQNPEVPGVNSTLVPITMNIQIVIPSDASSEQYDKIFASIKKFLTTQQ